MSVSGADLVFAAKKGTTWGTAVACGAMDGILVHAPTMEKDQPHLKDERLGLFWPQESDLGEITVAGQIPTDLAYSSLDLLLALFFGTHTVTHTVDDADSGTATSGSATTVVVSTGGFGLSDEHVGKFVTMTGGTAANIGQTRKIVSHTDTTLTVAADPADFPAAVANLDTFTISGTVTTHVHALAQTIDGLFATLVAKLGSTEIAEVPSAKITGLTIEGKTGQPVTIAFDYIGSNRKTDSAVNTTGTVATITYRQTKYRVIYGQIGVRMNAQDGAALGAGNVIYPVEFKLEAKRAMKGVYGAGGDYDQIDEPTNDGIPECSLSMKFGRHDAATVALIAAKDAGTAQKLDFTFTGALLGDAATARSIFIEIPNAKFKKASAPIVPGILEVPVEMDCMGCQVAPTGMTNLTVPMRLTAVNEFGGNPLQVGN